MRDDEFEEYVRATHERFCRAAMLLCGDWHRAEDLVQTALARAYLAQRRGPIENLDGYVWRTLVNTNTSWARRLWRNEVPTSDAALRAAGSAASGSARDEADVVARRVSVVAALQSLPMPQRAVLVLRYFGDYSEAEIAQLLGCSVGTVKSRASRALAALRDAGVLLDSEASASAREKVDHHE